MRALLSTGVIGGALTGDTGGPSKGYGTGGWTGLLRAGEGRRAREACVGRSTWPTATARSSWRNAANCFRLRRLCPLMRRLTIWIGTSA